MSKFRNLPEPPNVPGVKDLTYFQSLKYNLEILMGQRRQDLDAAAILRSDVKLRELPDAKLKRLKTGQQGITGTALTAAPATVVVTLAEYQELQTDVDALRHELQLQRIYLNSLVRNLHSGDQ